MGSKADQFVNQEEITVQPTADEISREKATTFWMTVAIIVGGTLLVYLFNKPINEFGISLMNKYGQNRVDFILFLITLVSCTPLVLPVWGYAMVGIAMGYDVYHLATVMAIGSALGSTVTLLLGRYFSHHRWIKKKFPNLENHPWTKGKSKLVVTMILIFGTASPIPMDVFYAACGLKQYPVTMFIAVTMVGRFIRYVYLGLGFDFFNSLL